MVAQYFVLVPCSRVIENADNGPDEEDDAQDDEEFRRRGRKNVRHGKRLHGSSRNLHSCFVDDLTIVRRSG